MLQDLDAMRQDLATYASDLKVEQDHAVSTHSMLMHWCYSMQFMSRLANCHVQLLVMLDYVD